MAIRCGNGFRPDATGAGLTAALDSVERAAAGRYVIIERSDGEYMQCLARRDWQLEKREGGADRHFDAARADDYASPDKLRFLQQIDARGERFSSRLARNEIEVAMLSYLRREPEPRWLVWRAVQV